jgi:hypothetical protein
MRVALYPEIPIDAGLRWLVFSGSASFSEGASATGKDVTVSGSTDAPPLRPAARLPPVRGLDEFLETLAVGWYRARIGTGFAFFLYSFLVLDRRFLSR